MQPDSDDGSGQAAVAPRRAGRWLLQLGFVLFGLGLVTGFLAPMLANYRMGISSHLEGIMNGMFLVLLGLVWPRLKLPPRVLWATFGVALYGTFVNWLATLLAAIWGAGSMMPLAAEGRQASALQEGIITFLLLSLSAAMLAVTATVVVGLRGRDTPSS